MDLEFPPTFEAWRDAARGALARGVEPDAVNWVERGRGVGAERPGGERELFSAAAETFALAPTAARAAPTVPKAFLDLASSVAAHRDPLRWRLLYRLLWRIVHEDRELLAIASDDDVCAAQRWAKQVHRDIHKMHAFVRFRKVAAATGDEYVAWHVPDHHIVRLATPFFARRFAAMRWTILTPDESARWDGRNLSFIAGAPAAPRHEDELEELWKTYYGATFNPARIKINMMKREMPVRYWRTMPETALIGDLLADASRRVETMIAAQPTSAAPFVPASSPPDAARSDAEISSPPDLATLAAAARSCRGCDLCAHATQTVVR